MACIACKQIWYADDAAAAGLLKFIKLWWNSLTKVGPGLGYFPNPKKTWLVVKPEFLNEATELFKDPGIRITTSGQRYLGAAIGSVQFKETYVKEKVEEWVKELNELSVVAKTEPQLAYAAYIFGLSKRWMYLMRTMEDISHLYQPLEDCIKNVFLPSFLQFSFSDSERKLFICLQNMEVSVCSTQPRFVTMSSNLPALQPHH